MMQWILLLAGLFTIQGPATGDHPVPAPVSNKLLFIATMKEERNTDNSRRGGDLLKAYTQVDKNEGQVFDPVSGVFTAPADGVYHLSGRFSIGCYQCRTLEYLRMPVSFGVTLMKNNSATYHAFQFPVAYSGVVNSRPNTRSHEFNVLVKLKAGDKMSIRYRSMKCGAGKEPLLYEVTFSGIQVY